MISGTLVILVVFAFLRSFRATLIPAVAVPVSLIGTFGIMYLFGYSLDNLSLMALTIATGFVVDDAIVVLENITRYLEKGEKPFRAALLGAKEIAFTVLSMSVSLVAVFIPLLLMGGMVGRLFREFSVTLSAAILISLVVSLTTTPMMCAIFLRSEKGLAHGRLYRASEGVFEFLRHTYERSSRMGLAALPPDALPDLAHLGDQYPLVYLHSQGLLPRTGHRPHHRHDPGGPGHLLSGHAGEAEGSGGHHQDRPGRGRCRGLQRRPRWRRVHHQYGAHVHLLEAL